MGTWQKIKNSLIQAREKKREFVKEVNWLQDFVGDRGTTMAEGLIGNQPKRKEYKKTTSRTDRYRPIRKKPPPRQSLPDGSAFLNSL